MMNRLQTLFNRLAGVLDQTALLQAGSGQGSPSRPFSALERPACWRRRSRILAQLPPAMPGKA